MNPLMAQLMETRKQIGLSQGDVGRIAGYAQESINQWENGVHEPRLSSFVNFANALGYEVVLVEKESKAA